MKQAILLTLGMAVLVAGGCKAKADNKDAIRDGVMKHIAGLNGLNVNNMTVTVTQANVHGDKAEANVDIRAKNGDPNAPPMQVTYQMQKEGEAWVVVKSDTGSSGMQHPKPGEMPPPGSVPSGNPHQQGAGQMPGSQPDFNSILKTAQPQGQQPAGHPAPSSAQQPSSSSSNYTKP